MSSQLLTVLRTHESEKIKVAVRGYNLSVCPAEDISILKKLAEGRVIPMALLFRYDYGTQIAAITKLLEMRHPHIDDYLAMIFTESARIVEKPCSLFPLCAYRVYRYPFIGGDLGEALNYDEYPVPEDSHFARNLKQKDLGAHKFRYEACSTIASRIVYVIAPKDVRHFVESQIESAGVSKSNFVMSELESAEQDPRQRKAKIPCQKRHMVEFTDKEGTSLAALQGYQRFPTSTIYSRRFAEVADGIKDFLGKQAIQCAEPQT